MNKKPVTLKDLLKLDSFTTRMRLVNTHGDLSKQVIHVTIMEGPDLYEWVTGGEFVLTTWYAFSKNPELQDKYFSQLAKKVSAVGIKTKRFIDKIPESVIALADKYKLPLFEINRETKFREVVQIITSEIQNYQTNLLIEVEEHYQRLVKITLSSDSIDLLLAEFGRRIKANSLCIDHEGKIVAQWNIKNKQNPVENLSTLLAKLYENYADKKYYLVSKKDGVHIFECYARNTLIGMLVILKAGELGEKEKLIARQTASFLAIKLWEKYETKKKSVEKFWDKLKVEPDLEEIFISSTLQKLGLDSNTNYKIFLLSKVIAVQKLDNCLMVLADKIIRIEEDYFIIITTINHVSVLLNRLEICMSEFAKDYIIVESEEISDAMLIKDQYEITLQVIEFLKKLNLKGSFFGTDWISYSLILRSKKSPEYKFIYTNVVLPILWQDQKSKSNLFESLWVALHSESLEQAAGKLFVHLNTLRYRLGKIHELTKKNYFKTGDKYILMCACIIGKAENKDSDAYNF